jgi:hypothetical protein
MCVKFKLDEFVHSNRAIYVRWWYSFERQCCFAFAYAMYLHF